MANLPNLEISSVTSSGIPNRFTSYADSLSIAGSFITGNCDMYTVHTAPPTTPAALSAPYNRQCTNASIWGRRHYFALWVLAGWSSFLCGCK